MVAEAEISKITSIQLHQSTKDTLDKLGNKGDTYEDIILRLVSFYCQSNNNN